jgi:hypothetical protein
MQIIAGQTPGSYLGQHDGNHYFCLDGQTWMSGLRYNWYSYEHVAVGVTRRIGDFWLWRDTAIGKLVRGAKS